MWTFVNDLFVDSFTFFLCVHTPTGEDRALFYWDLLFWSRNQAASAWVCFPQGLIPEKWLERHGFYCCTKRVSESPLFKVIIRSGLYKCAIGAKLRPCRSTDALLNPHSLSRDRSYIFQYHNQQSLISIEKVHTKPMFMLMFPLLVQSFVLCWYMQAFRLRTFTPTSQPSLLFRSGLYKSGIIIRLICW